MKKAIFPERMYILLWVKRKRVGFWLCFLYIKKLKKL